MTTIIFTVGITVHEMMIISLKIPGETGDVKSFPCGGKSGSILMQDVLKIR